MKTKEIENGLKAIEILEDQMNFIRSKVNDVLREIVQKDFPDINPENIYCPFFWECEKNPFGWCMYDVDEDPVMDNCIFCGEPYERK